MAGKLAAFWSTIGKKIVMGLTGLIMIGFLVEHLLGNLLLLLPTGELFNMYAHRLMSFGWLLIVAELFLLAVLFGHVIAAVLVTRLNRASRPERYREYRSAGRGSRRTLASSTMIWSGIVILVFLIIHLKTFKFGHYYEVQIHGEEVRDLYRLVVETFASPFYAFGYSLAMLFLGLHLRHGFWSAFQSLGANHPDYDRLIQVVGYAVAAVLAVGFIVLPIWIHFRGGVA